MLRNLMNRFKRRKGFTLIELIIVVAIIAILVGLAIPKLMHVQQDSKIKTDIANAKTIANATATLITEDKLTVKDDGSIDDIEIINSTKDKDNAKIIDDYLQTVPVPKAVSGKHFTIKISKDKTDTHGTISVYVDAKQLYPEADLSYSK